MTKRYSSWSKRIEHNILACYLRATDQDRALGLEWYKVAHDDASRIAVRYQVPLDRVIGVIAALSPSTEWGRNLLESEWLISAHVKGHRLPMVGVYGKRNVAKAVRILANGHALTEFSAKTSPKVRAFYQCLLHPETSDVVCIDRHAKALALNIGSSRKGYASNDELSTVRSAAESDYLARHYQRIAKRLGLVPHQLQAICWVTWKRLAGDVKSLEVPF